ncbi:MAG TPA: helix-turn-helix domain-containing protein [Patescibacteria group bacterium]|nr:helix-turn-helix domain-containing protein [Patescibacteria group bacterium]
MNITVHTITAEVASYYSIKVDEIYSMRKFYKNIKYKHIVIYFIRNILKMSLSAIGQEFPGKKGYLDHATISHSLRSVSNQIDTNPIYREEVNNIRKRLESLIKDTRKIDEEVYQENDFYLN